jgi:hypothetical protein
MCGAAVVACAPRPACERAPATAEGSSLGCASMALSWARATRA